MRVIHQSGPNKATKSIARARISSNLDSEAFCIQKKTFSHRYDQFSYSRFVPLHMATRHFSEDELPIDKETSNLLSLRPSEINSIPRDRGDWKVRWCSGLNLLLGLLLSMLTVSAHLALIVYNNTVAEHASCASEQAWSPVLDSVPARSEKFNETFAFTSTHPSIYQQPSVEEAEKQWARFTSHPMLDGTSGRLGVSKSAISRMKKAQHDKAWLDSAVKIGDDKYMVNLDIFHNAHCLNMLRKLLYPDHFSLYVNVVKERGHLEHCVETLRQAIFCNSGMGLVTFHWVKGIEEPYPDYNSYHQ